MPSSGQVSLQICQSTYSWPRVSLLGKNCFPEPRSFFLSLLSVIPWVWMSLDGFLKVFSFSHKSTGTLGKKNTIKYAHKENCVQFLRRRFQCCVISLHFFFKQLGDFSMRTLLGEIILDPQDIARRGPVFLSPSFPLRPRLM